MKANDRWSNLLEILGRTGRVTVEGAASDLGVSAATIRRDLDHLVSNQLATRTRGGAVATGVAYDLPLRYKSGHLAEEKHAIGDAATERIPAGAVVGFNGGTTVAEVARALALRADLAHGDRHAITVVTNALNIATELVVRPHIKVVVIGGVARTNSYELVGPLGRSVLEGLHLDWAIIGVNGVDPTIGASAHHEGEADCNALMVERAHSVMVVADSSKIGRRALARICRPDEIDVLVTDDGITETDRTAFDHAGTEVVVAPHR